MSKELPTRLWIVFEGVRPAGVFLGCFTDREAAQRMADARRNRFPAYVVPYDLAYDYAAQLDYERSTD